MKYSCQISIIYKGSSTKKSGIIQRASYNSRTSLLNQETGLKARHNWNKTKSQELIFSKIYLPKTCDQKFKDRTFLWNYVSSKYKPQNSRLARELVLALPLGYSKEICIKMIDDFSNELISNGLICDVNLHWKEESGTLINPHVHILVTEDQIENGLFKKRTSTYYECVNNQGNIKHFESISKLKEHNQNNKDKYIKIPLYKKNSKGALILDENGNPIQKTRIRKGKGEEKLWKKTTKNHSWWTAKNSYEYIREKWASSTNKYMKNRDKWSHMSFKRQGKLKIPEIRLGSAAYHIEKQEKQRCKKLDIPYKPITFYEKINVKIRKFNKWVASIMKSTKNTGSLSSIMSKQKRTKNSHGIVSSFANKRHRELLNIIRKQRNKNCSEKPENSNPLINDMPKNNNNDIATHQKQQKRTICLER